MMIVARGITTEGVKIPLGPWEGSTDNAAVATALLSDLGWRQTCRGSRGPGRRPGGPRLHAGG